MSSLQPNIVSELENIQMFLGRQAFACRHTLPACALTMKSTKGRHLAAASAASLRMLQKRLFLKFGDDKNLYSQLEATVLAAILACEYRF